MELPSFLSIQYDSEDEQKYISGLFDQFENATKSDSYHLALFAYHLLFICYFYQTLHKLKIWMPDKHHISMVSFDKERRKKFREAINPTDYAHNENKESSFFEFLNIFCDCEDLVVKCKNLVKYRNVRLGHVNYLLVSKEMFEDKLREYNEIVTEIQKLTHEELERVFFEYFNKIDPSIIITRDDIETDLIIPNKLSDKDLECLTTYCLINPNDKKTEISKILEEDFGIYIGATQ